MFGKKKNVKEIPCVHYEGIEGFATDYPCQLLVTDTQVIIKRIKPETEVVLPLDRVKSFTHMYERDFMLKYHGNAVETSKMKGVHKSYLVIEYDKGKIVLWGTAAAGSKFIDLQYKKEIAAPSKIEL